jgi:hypothetical protein
VGGGANSGGAVLVIEAGEERLEVLAAECVESRAGCVVTQTFGEQSRGPWHGARRRFTPHLPRAPHVAATIG